MANSIHKGSEFSNITETWDRNEQKRDDRNTPDRDTAGSEPAQASALDQVIRQEAAEYDNEPKENQLLTGDRATLSDDLGTDDSGA